MFSPAFPTQYGNGAHVKEKNWEGLHVDLFPEQKVYHTFLQTETL